MTLFRIFLSFFAFSLVCSDVHSAEKRPHEEEAEVLTQSQQGGSFTYLSDDTFATKKEDPTKRPKLAAASKSSPKKKQPVKETSPRLPNKETSLPPTRSIPRAISAPKQIKADAFYYLYCEIIKKGPHLIQPIKSITAQDEDGEGSRKWVKTFNDPLSHIWHKESSVIIREMRKVNDGDKFVPVETNFAMARLTFVLTEEEQPAVIDIPFFFVSGWPATDHRDSILAFSKKLSEGKTSSTLQPYNTYGLRFIGLAYQGKEKTSVRNGGYDTFKKELDGILTKELQDPSKVISESRLQSHLNLVRSGDNNILGKLYLHSEQSIWHCVKGEIKKFREKHRQKSTGNIKKLMTKDLTDPIHYVILDICTFYDVCWCCGDTITSCSHTLNLDAKVLVRATGCEAYYDQPLEKTAGPLRDHRLEFRGYEAGTAYELAPTFKPYIAHAAGSDLL